MKRKRQASDNEHGTDSEEKSDAYVRCSDLQHNGGSSKSRISWIHGLHNDFVMAVDRLGGPDKATPKGIHQFMHVPGLTLAHIKSHLQRWRLVTRSCDHGGDHSTHAASCHGGGAQVPQAPPGPSAVHAAGQAHISHFGNSPIYKVASASADSSSALTRQNTPDGDAASLSLFGLPPVNGEGAGRGPGSARGAAALAAMALRDGAALRQGGGASTLGGAVSLESSASALNILATLQAGEQLQLVCCSDGAADSADDGGGAAHLLQQVAAAAGEQPLHRNAEAPSAELSDSPGALLDLLAAILQADALPQAHQPHLVPAGGLPAVKQGPHDEGSGATGAASAAAQAAAGGPPSRGTSAAEQSMVGQAVGHLPAALMSELEDAVLVQLRLKQQMQELSQAQRAVHAQLKWHDDYLACLGKKACQAIQEKVAAAAMVPLLVASAACTQPLAAPPPARPTATAAVPGAAAAVLAPALAQPQPRQQMQLAQQIAAALSAVHRTAPAATAPGQTSGGMWGLPAM